VLYGAGGNDTLLGGTGNDDLFGGSGNDVLIGGGGNDDLFGDSGRDLLIGSDNNDRLEGGNDDDILVGGTTAYDSYDPASKLAIDNIMATWTGGASFTSRVGTLTGSGGPLEGGIDVLDDDDNDTLIAGSGRDLIFGDNSALDGAIDTISMDPLLDVLVPVI
jgi:Ca2+-binding RTX toxin-like protein